MIGRALLGAFVLCAIFALSDASKSTEMAEAVVESAKKLTSVMQKLETNLLQPFVIYAESEIRGISGDLKGLSSSEKSKLNDAKSKLRAAKSDINKVRATLKGLARETVTKAGVLKVDLKNTLWSSGEKQINTLKSTAGKMKSLLDRSKGILQKAISEYERVTNVMAVVKSKLGSFSTSVTNLASSRSAAHDRACRELRTKAYAGATAGWAGGPIGYLIAMGIAAGVAESQINNWKNAVNRLRSKCASTVARVNGVVDKVSKGSKVLHAEAYLIRQWDNKVAAMYGEFSNINDYVDFIQWDEETKQDSINQIDALVKACQSFANKNVSG